MEEMAQWLLPLGGGRKAKRLYLQCFVDRETVLRPGLTPPTAAQLETFAALLAPAAERVELRGV